MAKSLYIHIPFCKNKCPYCDFYSIEHRKELADSMLDVICKQISALDNTFETIYIGGGTPTVLETSSLRKLLKKLKKIKSLVQEFTVEANPESLTESKIKLLFDHGVNRISIGCQSFNDKKLNFLERIHSAKESFTAIKQSVKAGFKNISIDLIYGLPGETVKVLEKDIAQATELPITHLSAYMLTYEQGTPLFAKLKTNQVLSLSEDKVAKMYNQLIELLGEKKFFQYEISNFSKKGSESIHNFRYWRNEPYVGIGPAATSFLKGVRTKNISSLLEYIKAVEKKEKVWEYREKLTDFAVAKETAALKIRTMEGIDFNWFQEKTGFNFLELEKESLPELISQKLIECRYRNRAKRGVALTKKGILFADTVSSAFL